MTPKPQLRLTTKLLMLFVLFAAVLLALMGLLTSKRVRAGLEAATISDLLSTAMEKEAALTGWINERQTDLDVLSILPDVRENLAVLISAEPGSDAAQSARDRLIMNWQPRIGEDRGFRGIFAIDPADGKVIAATDVREEGTFKENQPYFINGKTGPYVQNPYYSLFLQSPTMAISTPVVTPEGALIAVLAGQLKLEEMGDIISRHTDLQ